MPRRRTTSEYPSARKFLVASIAFYFNFGFFELVNFIVDGFKVSEVACPIEASAGCLSKLHQSFFVDFVAVSEKTRADSTGADCVDFYIESSGGGCGVLR